MAARVLIIAAHPDDEVLGCGGTIAKFRDRGDAVRVVFLAEGITARYRPEQFDEPAVRAEMRERNDNAYKALDHLGVGRDEIFVNERYSCRLDQVPMIDLVKEIEGHIREFQPSQLFTHWSEDVNVDHAISHRAVLAAVRPTGPNSLKRVMAFEVLSSSEWNTTVAFPANVFHEVSQQIDRKLGAMAAYGEEMRRAPHPRSPEVIRALAVFRGCQAGLACAEAFSLIRSLEP